MLTDLNDALWGGLSAVAPATAALRLTSAVLLGALVGIEREIKKKPAGLRTHIMVSVAACLFIISQDLATLPFGVEDRVRVDPLRPVEAVTAGVAFLGAGVIFQSGGRVRNMTTGTAMWLAGAIGLACGAGQIWLAARATVLVLIVIWILGWVEDRISDRG